MPEVPSFAALVAQLRRTFQTNQTRPLDFRKQQLRQVVRLLDENEDAICAAVHEDIRRHKVETLMYEFMLVKNEVNTILRELDTWAKPKKVRRCLLQIADSAYTIADPLGVVLILGTWNYPVMMLLQPALGAIAAGNCVVMKPSEVAPRSAAKMAELVPKYLDQSCYRLVTGGVPEAIALLAERFDHIFCTGSTTVGRSVMQAACKYLTPVTLEMGGKSPAIVDTTCDIELTAKRIAWGKFLSCGQTCLAPDYIICVESKKRELIEGMKAYIRTAFGEDAQTSPDYSRIINERHFDRLMKLLKSGRIVHGGRFDRKDLFIEPTILDDVEPDDPVMHEEIFGPIFPIITVKSIDEAIEFVNEREKPLSIYLFSNSSAVVKKVIARTSAGGVTVNDCILHVVLDSLPFGGVGKSGIGRYHGQYSFDTFSHEKAVLHRAMIFEQLLWMRYPPMNATKLSVGTFLGKNRRLPKLERVLCCVLFLAVGVFLGLLLRKYIDAPAWM